MTPKEKKHVTAALGWLDDAKKMIARRDLVDTSDSVNIATRELESALALSGPSHRKKKA
ncbi:MAG TPA: hypothetical protein PKN47_01725 [Nitrospira sp.]|nr:hypothetical protein [Nitrospira sp.]